ncbi:MAG: type II toxin-antitoxin system prevent-host-death family antitoxin [Patescibacteria group bacterium]
MIQLSVSQARNDFLKLANRVYAGEEIVVVKNGVKMMVMSPVKNKKRVIKKRILPGATKLMGHLKGDSVDIVNEWRRQEDMRSYGG